MQVIWEKLNQIKWVKIQQKEQEYVFDFMKDFIMEDVLLFDEEEEEEDEIEDELVCNEKYDFDEE